MLSMCTPKQLLRYCCCLPAPGCPPHDTTEYLSQRHCALELVPLGLGMELLGAAGGGADLRSTLSSLSALTFMLQVHVSFAG